MPHAPKQKTLLSFFQNSSSPVKSHHLPKKVNPPSSPPLQSLLVGTATPSSTSNDLLENSSSSFEPQSSPLKHKSQPAGFARNNMIIDSDDEDFEIEPVSSADFPLSQQSTNKRTLSTSQNTLDDSGERPVPSKVLKTDESGLSKFSATSEYQPRGPRKRPETSTNVKTGSPLQKPKEERYAWLLDIRDADKKPVGHPNYDCRTLYIPPSAWAKFTAFEKQYWEIKCKLWDTVVFFKKGKFYELYENDAEIAHRDYDLKLAGGGRANMQLAGIPEMSFEYWASRFISNGHKVAKVDQSETSIGKEMRDACVGKKEEKIIKRQLSCILTTGTLTDEKMLSNDLAQYCLAIRQNQGPQDEGPSFGIAFVDTATGAFHLSQFQDSRDLHVLETFLAQLRPREIIMARNNLCKLALKVIKNNVPFDALYNTLRDGDEFWDAETAALRLASGNYFPATNLDDWTNVPEPLNDARTNSPLLMSAFGGLLWYLQSLKLDMQLISLGNFSEYSPKLSSYMVLDGQTLQNLEIFANTHDGGAQYTLFKVLNWCVTPFGKRKLRTWIAYPLLDISEIAQRQDAVQLLKNDVQLLQDLESLLSGIPDLERLLSRVHAGSLRPKDFVRVVQGLDRAKSVLERVKQCEQHSSLLHHWANRAPDISGLLEEWLNAFDYLKAKENDELIPEPGVEVDFDEKCQAVKDIEHELDTVLKHYRRDLKCMSACYRDSGKEIYLIEVPSKTVVPNDWQQMSATIKVKRYWSPQVRDLVRKLQEALELRRVSSMFVKERVYKKFMQHYSEWLDVTTVTASIDCILSMARASLAMVVSCRPKLTDSATSSLYFEDLRHPCASETFIPNTMQLGGSKPNISLLTGANAAGKSTVLRTTACAVIMAQMGCDVPASSAELTPVDRIMTRLGANDNIFAGKSTFHVELSETQRILAEATNRSLIVIDELGRGGSSSDGFAIAEAVLHQLASHVGCLGYFATHYGTLVDTFRTHPCIRPQRMAILINEKSHEVTFLYKLEDGQSEGSFGMNVALMCGVSAEIVAAAGLAASEHEHTMRLKKVGFQGVPLGLESDVVFALSSMPSSSAVRVMLEMAKNL